jgi:hypothetical protein
LEAYQTRNVPLLALRQRSERMQLQNLYNVRADVIPVPQEKGWLASGRRPAMHQMQRDMPCWYFVSNVLRIAPHRPEGHHLP